MTVWNRFTVKLQNFGSVHQLCFSPDGKSYAVSGFGGAVRIFDSKTGKQLLHRPAHKVRTSSTDFCAHTDRIVSTGATEAIVWDRNSIRPPVITRSDQAYISAFEFVHGKNLVALAGGRNIARAQVNLTDTPSANSIHIFDMDSSGTNARLPVSVLKGADGWCSCMDVSRTEKHLAVGTENGGISVWDLESSEQVAQFDTQQNSVADVVFLNATELLSLSESGIVDVWNIKSKERVVDKVSDNKNLFSSIGFGEKSSLLALVSKRELLLVDATAKETKWNLKLKSEPAGIKFNQSGDQIALHFYDGSVEVFRLGSQDGRIEKVVDQKFELQGIIDLAFNPDGTRLAIYSSDGSVVIFDMHSRSELLKLETLGQSNHYFDIHFSGDGKHLAASARGRDLTIWSATNR